MKTETRLIYVSFSKYSDNGVAYHVFDEDLREHLDKQEEYSFLCDVVLPHISSADISKLATNSFDYEIAQHAAAIEMLNADRQKFLAIEHNPGE